MVGNSQYFYVARVPSHEEVVKLAANTRIQVVAFLLFSILSWCACAAGNAWRVQIDACKSAENTGM